MIDVAPIGARLDKSQLLLGVDPDRSHAHEVDHDRVVGHSVRRTGALSSHRDRDIVRPTVVNCRHDVPHNRDDDEAQWIRAQVQIAVKPPEAAAANASLSSRVISCPRTDALRSANGLAATALGPCKTNAPSPSSKTLGDLQKEDLC